MSTLSIATALPLFLACLAGIAGAQTPARSVASQSDDQFVVRPGNVLRITVWPDNTLGGEFPVEESGFVHLPVLGAVHVGGMSLETLRNQLREAYGEAILVPVVTVTPLFWVSVLGAVNRPGLYRVDPTQSLFDVLSLAGGMRQDAKEDELRLIRGEHVIEINATRALETGEAQLTLALRSGDRIVVPRRRGFWSPQNINLIIQSTLFVVTIIELATR